MDIRLGIIFNGGGFSGAYSVGYAKAVRAFGLKPACCQGISVGSLTAASYAEKNGDPKEAEQTWLKIEQEGPRSIFPILDIPRRIRKGGLFSNKGIYQLANRIDYKKLINSQVRFDTIVYDETAEKQEIFSNRDKHCADNPLILKNAIVASCSLRGFLDPIFINEKFYSDGISFLIKPLAQMECNVIFIFLNEPLGISAHTGAKWWLPRLLAGIHSMNNLLENKEIESAKNANHNIAALSGIMKEINAFGAVKRLIFRKTFNRLSFTFEGKRQIELVLFRPTELIPTLWSLGFGKGDISYAIKNGYESGNCIIENFLKEFS